MLKKVFVNVMLPCLKHHGDNLLNSATSSQLANKLKRKINDLSVIKWAIPEKKQTGRLRTYFFEKTTWNFLIFHFTPRNSRQTELHPWKFHIVLHPLEIPS